MVYTPKRACKHTRKKDGGPCTRPAALGADVCAAHGAIGKRNLQQEIIRRYGRPAVDDDHPAASPVTGLIWELKRTASNILAMEAQLSNLDPVSELQITTLREGAALDHELRELGLPARNLPTIEHTIRTTQEITPFTHLYLKERAHYLQLLRLALGAGLEQRRLDLIESQVQDTVRVIMNTVRDLGLDVEDPRVRQTIHANLLSLKSEPDERYAVRGKRSAPGLLGDLNEL